MTTWIYVVISYAHHFSLYFSIRLFGEMGYSIGLSDSSASLRTSSGVLQWYICLVGVPHYKTLYNPLWHASMKPRQLFHTFDTFLI